MDAQSYGSKNDRAQSETQHDLPRLLDGAARRAGLDRSEWQIQRKGDEQLAVLPMNGDEPRLVDDYFRHLVSELSHYNGQRTAAARLRLRAAVHHGPVELADNGFAGTAVVVTARLLNSRLLYDALDAHGTADLALMLSDDVFRSTVAGGHTTLRTSDFSRVTVKEKEYESAAWLTVPASSSLPPFADAPPTPADAPPARADAKAHPDGDAGPRGGYHAHQISVTNMSGPVDAHHAVFGFGNTDA
ncbi:hypothetical protein OG562_23275 [Streptomyces sp. NBC_01275]|uniref:hypothetical protein n=1 Tax=Streptomyces sp. NBC_01275 TaxID=2903807 RepID=UPI0022577CDB|nr:hypothetical protein [Streptomyces sp. NBC_01275]MCX4763836.1 hypothetical protein [Streptomyces sp. NBC_01275]